MSDINFKKASFEEILELTNSKDPETRKLVSSQLSAMGLKPPQYLKWSAEQRAKAIAEHFGSGSGGSKKSSSGGKATTATEKAASSGSVSGSTNSGGVSSEELKELEARITARFDEITEALNEVLTFLKETHFMTVATAATLGADVSDATGLGDLMYETDEGNDEG